MTTTHNRFVISLELLEFGYVLHHCNVKGFLCIHMALPNACAKEEIRNLLWLASAWSYNRNGIIVTQDSRLLFVLKIVITIIITIIIIIIIIIIFIIIIIIINIIVASSDLRIDFYNQAMKLSTLEQCQRHI